MTKILLPMLAKSFHTRYLDGKAYVYLQPKLDGQRAVFQSGGLYSRTGKPILNVPHIIEECKSIGFGNTPLDGELYLHGKSLQEIISSSRKTVNLETNSLEYHVYDLAMEKWTFEERYKALTKLVKNTCQYIKIVPILKLTAPYDTKNLNIYPAEGYEGTMLRIPNGLYKFGKRSADLLKIKDFEDDEFKIIGITELMHKEKVIVPVGTPGSKLYADGRAYKDGAETAAHTMGSLILECNGGTFEVGTGFSDELRLEFWKNFSKYKGRFATIKYQRLTADGIPFLPVFVCMRDYE